MEAGNLSRSLLPLGCGSSNVTDVQANNIQGNAMIARIKGFINQYLRVCILFHTEANSSMLRPANSNNESLALDFVQLLLNTDSAQW